MKNDKYLADQAPAGIVVDRFGPELTITRSWRKPWPWLWLGVPFCIVWNSFVWGFIVAAAFSPDPRVSFFLALHGIFGVCLAYTVLCRAFNRTLIYVSQDRLRVRHGPLPWLGNCDHATDCILQLFCVETKGPGKGVRFAYDVMLWKSDDTQEPLVSGIEDENQALFIERRIEQHLNLRKERIPPGFQLRQQRRAG